VLLRVSNMRGVDLDVFDFDFDLTWAALFLSPEGKTLGRYGSREASSSSSQLSLEGLRYALEQALKRQHAVAASGAKAAHANAGPGKGKTVEDYPAIGRLAPKACIHCHQVYEFRREAKQAAGTWSRSELWVYPEPANVGLLLDIHQGNKIVKVLAPSAAAEAGIAAGDILREINGVAIASIADVQFALHGAPPRGRVTVSWKRGNKDCAGVLELKEGWRTTDLSWRWSLKSLAPAPCVHGDDLSAMEKQALGLTPASLAFRQGPFLSVPARHAGIQINDIIIGVDHRKLEMSARQFEVYVRVNYHPGDTVIYNILRGKLRLNLPLRFPG